MVLEKEPKEQAMSEVIQCIAVIVVHMWDTVFSRVAPSSLQPCFLIAEEDPSGMQSVSLRTQVR